MPQQTAVRSLTLVSAVLLCQLLYFVPQLPEPMASHFAANGQPNGWMSHVGYIAFELGLLALLGALFVGIPQLTRRVGPHGVNVPHREYWFSPERREQSSQRLLAALLWLLAGIVVFFIAINQLVFDANRSGSGLSSPHILALFGAALPALLGWLVYLWRLFPRPPA